jgi:hypothetical protein
MSDFQINDHILTKECEGLAADIFGEYVAKLGEDETPEDYRDEMDDRAHEDADRHEWVIYNWKSLMLCAHCDTDLGADFMDDIGFEWKQGESTIHTVASALAYGEIRARISGALNELIESWEDPRAAA